MALNVNQMESLTKFVDALQWLESEHGVTVNTPLHVVVSDGHGDSNLAKIDRVQSDNYLTVSVP